MNIKSVYYNFIFLLLTAYSALAQTECPVIPLPNHYQQTNGVFVINKYTSIVIKDTSLNSLAWYLQQSIKSFNGVSLKVSSQDKDDKILLERINASTNAENYSLSMTKNAIIISSSTDEGLFDGIISLMQLMRQAPVNKSGTVINCWNIRDTAKYKWRGLMLDESRHFFGKETVKLILDWMALYKLNRFHWHLTDQPGWRFQVTQYPRLTSVGAIGNHSDSTAPAAYYTDADIEEIVQYAAARYITVIPEIDMPGHATAANRAYPEFSGGGAGRYANFTFNPGNTKTYSYLTNILRETKKLFPSKMIHLGGDEVSFGSESWKNDRGVQELMKRQNLPDLKVVELYFIRRMEDSALKIYNKVLLWDEAADASLPADRTIICWWRHDKPAQLEKALQKGYRVVLCPRIPFYFDFVQDSSHQQGRKWQGNFSSLDKVYNFPNNEPYRIDITSKLILGIQADLWTETVRTEKRLEYLLFPRISALSEAAWTNSNNRNYDNFLTRLKKHLLWYQASGIHYFDPFYPEQTPEVID
ncbi:MAG: beta-N-acetylhexosaminidase [Ginsengibacter sp.]